MPMKPSRAGTAAATVLLVAVLQGCDAWTDVLGTVTETDGTPIAGALIRLTRTDGTIALEEKTESDGTFAVAVPHGLFTTKFQLEVEAPGYHAVTQDVAAKQRHQLVIGLRRREASSGDGK